MDFSLQILAELPHGIRPLIRLGFWELYGWWVAGGCALLVIALFLVLKYYYKKNDFTVPQDPHETALGQLDEIELQTNATDKAFSEAASATLRQYIETVYAINAPEQTTDEFLQAAREDRRFDVAAVESLADFLTLCDLAKFAQHGLRTDDRSGILSNARAFITTTRERLTPKPDGDSLAENLQTLEAPAAR